MNDEQLRDFVRSRSNAELTNILTIRRTPRPRSRRQRTSALHLWSRRSPGIDEGARSSPAGQLAKLTPLVAAEIAERPEDPSLAALAQLLGDGLAALGRFKDALATYEEARALYKQFGEEAEAARCQMNRANALAKLSRFQEALVGFQEALSVFRGSAREAKQPAV